MKRFMCVLFLLLAVPLWTVTAASAMEVNPGGQGDALLGEFYKIDYSDGAGYTTFFTIANTHERRYAEVHVRLRSGQHSIEVWDKQIILSPMDKTWFQLEQDENGYYIYGEKVDKTYLSMTLLNTVGFTADGDIDQMAMGYIEVFGIHGF